MKELRKSFWDFVTSLGSSFLAIPLMIFSEAIQARYLGPDRYGQIALIISAISFFFLFGISWTERSIIRFGKEEFIKFGHIRKTTGNYIIITLFSFLAVFVIFFIFKDKILKFLNIKSQKFIFVILAGLFLFSLKNFVFETLKVVNLIKVQAVLMRLFSKTIILVGLLPIVFHWVRLSVWYVILVFLLSDFLVALIGLYFIKFEYLFPIQIDKKLLKKMISFSFPLLFTAWTFYITTWVDTFIIKYYMKMKDVGIYQAAYKVLSTGNSILISSVITVTTPLIMAFKARDEVDKIKNLFMKRIVPQVSFFSMIIVAIILLFADIGFYLVYGHKFDQSVLPFKILITTVNLSIVSASINGIRISFDMTRMMFIMGIFAAVVNFVADVILVQKFGILGAAWASFTVFSLNPIIWYFYIYSKLGVKRYLSLLFPIFTVGIMFTNILLENILLRFLITLLLIVVAFSIGNGFNLFNRKDISLIERIKMPEKIKIFYEKLLLFASKWSVKGE